MLFASQIKQAEKLKSRKMKDERWKMKEERWMLKVEGWTLNIEGWRLYVEGFGDRQTNKWMDKQMDRHL